MPEKKDEEFSLDGEEDKTWKTTDLTILWVREIKKTISAAIEEEDYEKASELRDEIKKRNQN